GTRGQSPRGATPIRRPSRSRRTQQVRDAIGASNTPRPGNGGVSGGYYLREGKSKKIKGKSFRCRCELFAFAFCLLPLVCSATPRPIPRLRSRRLRTWLPALWATLRPRTLPAHRRWLFGLGRV